MSLVNKFIGEILHYFAVNELLKHCVDLFVDVALQNYDPMSHQMPRHFRVKQRHIVLNLANDVIFMKSSFVKMRLNYSDTESWSYNGKKMVFKRTQSPINHTHSRYQHDQLLFTQTTFR